MNDKELREQILDWYKSLGTKPAKQDKLLTVTPTELEKFITAKVIEARKPNSKAIARLIGVSAGLSQTGHKRTAEVIDEVIATLQSQGVQI